MWRAALLLVGISFLALACTGGSGRPPVTPTATSAIPAIAAGKFVRACSTSVYGQLSKQLRRQSVVVGPLLFVWLRGSAHIPPSSFKSHDGRYEAFKVLAVVERGGPVTVEIPPSARHRLALLYNPAAFRDDGLYRIVDGDGTVTFDPCATGGN